MKQQMKTFFSTFLLLVAFGCAHRSPSYVAGGVYSTGPVGGLSLYGIHKVLAAGPKQLLVYQSTKTFSQPPTALSQFPTNEAVIPGVQYFKISFQDFERRHPVFIGKLPLTADEMEAASNK